MTLLISGAWFWPVWAESNTQSAGWL